MRRRSADSVRTIRNRGPLRLLSQLVGLVRRELGDIVGQPRLLLLLVLGPFLILFLFAGGYDEERVVLRTLFVAPADSVYAEAIADHEDDLARYIDNQGFTEDLVAARNAVKNNEADLVVVFPADPAETVLEGEQATIAILHDKIDPIQTTAVEIAAQLAVLELNASVLEAVVGEAQSSLEGLDDTVAEARVLAQDLPPLLDRGDAPALGRTAEELALSLDRMARVVSVSQAAAERLQADVPPEQAAAVDELEATLAELESVTGRLSEADLADPSVSTDIERAVELTADLEGQSGEVLALDPELIVRPFASDTESLLRTRIKLADFFAPSALALLIQHLVITLAAMALVRDEAAGLFEVYRVSPVRARHVVTGKYVSFVLIGGFVAALSLAGVVVGLGVPLRGATVGVVIAVGALVAASIGLGLSLSGVSRSELQAVQYAMILLLAGLFFSGFFISLDTLRYPVKIIAWLLPVTFGISILQDVMLRGLDPAPLDVVALCLQAVLFGAMASWLVHRRLRVA